MCGRIAQYRAMATYLEALQPDLPVINGYDDVPLSRYNVAPGTRVQILHDGGQGLRTDAVNWGWQPFWARGKKRPPINARIETITGTAYYRPLWPTKGRALVPADAWYEWVTGPNHSAQHPDKQPYLIRLKTDEPMFFAALAQVHEDIEHQEGDGFVIITGASDQGMVDIHDRRPLVLAADEARRWLNPTLTGAEAEQVALKDGRPVDEFEWFPVGKAVGSYKNQGPELIQPMASDFNKP